MPVDYTEILNTLTLFAGKECTTYDNITPEITYLVMENLLFMDFSTGNLKPQSKIDLIAIRQCLKEMASKS
ncbi:MAG: hypothetical protein QMD06_00385 [Candidatus Altarchaeum sp.]|nr:hypothetical protein [Candidatus Altarchaeum sp.]